MESKSNIHILSNLAASQNGLFTTAQAKAFGVARDAIAYLAKVKKVERIVHGVYRFHGSPTDTYEGIRAVWMSTHPAVMAYERLNKWDRIVIGGRSAAAIHGVGNFSVSPFKFFTDERINSKKNESIFSTRAIAQKDIDIIDGLPVTNIARTIFDLYKDHEDVSLLADVITDALNSKHNFDYPRLIEIFHEDSAAPRGCSVDALDKMFKAAGIVLVPLKETTNLADAKHQGESGKVILIGSHGKLTPLDSLLPELS